MESGVRRVSGKGEAEPMTVLGFSDQQQRQDPQKREPRCTKLKVTEIKEHSTCPKPASHFLLNMRNCHLTITDIVYSTADT